MGQDSIKIADFIFANLQRHRNEETTMEKWECSVVMAALQTDCVPLHIKMNCRIQCQDKENQIFALLWDNVVTMFYWKEQSFSNWTSPLAAASFSIPNTFSPLKLWGNLATLLVKSNTGELTLLWGQEVTPAASQPVQQMFFPKKGMLCSFSSIRMSPKYCVSSAAAFVQRTWH